jgi:hypothetical protein
MSEDDSEEDDPKSVATKARHAFGSAYAKTRKKFSGIALLLVLGPTWILIAIALKPKGTYALFFMSTLVGTISVAAYLVVSQWRHVGIARRLAALLLVLTGGAVSYVGLAIEVVRDDPSVPSWAMWGSPGIAIAIFAAGYVLDRTYRNYQMIGDGTSASR